MTCQRCSGTMFPERMYDPYGISVWITAQKCINCGNVLDDVIRRHQVVKLVKPAKQLPRRKHKGVRLF